eukprot:6198437-Pleurochrysis_carterae.AAC.1
MPTREKESKLNLDEACLRLSKVVKPAFKCNLVEVHVEHIICNGGAPRANDARSGGVAWIPVPVPPRRLQH